jgi:hypothetical protein
VACIRVNVIAIRCSGPTQVGTTPRPSFRAVVEPDGRVEIEAALKRMQSILPQP